MATLPCRAVDKFTAEAAENAEKKNGDKGIWGDEGTRIRPALGAQKPRISLSPIIPLISLP